MKKISLPIALALLWCGTTMPTRAASRALPREAARKAKGSLTCELVLPGQDPELGFVPKSIQLVPSPSADGHARWDLTLRFETYSFDERGKRVAIPQTERALLEYSCLKKGCTAITRTEEQRAPSRSLSLLYFKTFPSARAPADFTSDVVVVGRNPFALFVNVPVEVTAHCRTDSQG